MSDRAEEFLDYWCSEHVKTVPEARKQEEADALAAACLLDAATAGIQAGDIQEAAGGDLVKYMLEKLASRD